MVKNFLEGELGGGSSNGQTQIGDKAEGSMSLSGKVYAIVRGIVYYQPLFVLGRWSFRATSFVIRALITSLTEILPLLTDDKRLKFRVERFLGVLIGYFGPIIGYEYKLVEKTTKRPVGANRNRPIHVTDDQKKRQKFNCDVHIHQFNRGDRETANKRRMSMFQRRKSMSVDRLGPIGPPGFGTAQRRRFSIAPGLEGSVMRTGHLPTMPTFPRRSSESSSGSESEESGYDQDEEEETEILSMQVESYVDAPE